MHESPQAHWPLGQIMQQPVESSWHPIDAVKTAVKRNARAPAAKRRVAGGTRSILDDRI
jgi:hypothetical protein